MRYGSTYQIHNISFKDQIKLIGFSAIGFLIIFTVLAIILVNPDPVLMSGADHHIFDFAKLASS